MLGQLPKQHRSLVVGQKPYAARRLLEKPHANSTVDPFPIAVTSPQYCPYHCQMPVHCCVACAFCQLRVSYPVDQLSVNGLQLLAGQKRIEPSQLALVFLKGRLVCSLLEKLEHRIFPIPLRPFAKLLKPPRFRFQLVVEFFRLDFAFGLSASTYSLAVGRVEVDPPDRTS